MQVIRVVWDVFQNQILGMDWLKEIVKNALYTLGVDLSTRIGLSIHFFIYATAKIMILLSVLILLISYVQSYFPPDRTKMILGKYKGVKANIMGALLGTVTPFCSCSSIPLFIGFTNAGLPIGITFSFLISSPLVDLGALVLLMSVFGPGIAIAYVIVGLLLAVIGGVIIEKMDLSDQIEVVKKTCCSGSDSTLDFTEKERFNYAKEQVLVTVNKVWIYVIAGVGIGAIIHNWIPQNLIESILGTGNVFSVIIATVVGIPMYADIFGSIAIAEALYTKGVGIGTLLSFMMAVTALSVPSIIMLKRVVKQKLLFIFVGIVAGGIVIIGYVFNALGFLFV